MKYLILFCCLMAFTGCATRYSVDAYKNNKNVKIVRDGHSILAYENPVVIGIGTAPEGYISSQRPKFLIVVKNDTGEQYDFFTRHISAEINDKPVKIMGYQELYAEEMRARQINAFLIALSGFAQMQQAQNNAYQPYSGNYTANTNQYQISGTYSGYAYNPALATINQQAVQSAMLNNIDTLNRLSDARIKEIGSIAVKDNTVLPFSQIGGYFLLKDTLSGDSGTIKIKYSYLGLEQIFEFNYAKIKENQ